MGYDCLRTGETSSGAPGFDVQHGVDGGQAARREAIVVLLVARRGSGEHNVVAVVAAGRAYLRVVL